MSNCRRKHSELAFAALTVAGLACCFTSTVAAEPGPQTAQNEKWRKAYQGIASSVKMHRGDRPLEPQPVPLLFYTNPVRTNDQHGAIFLWTEKGRPAVLGSIWSALNRQDSASRNVTHEWHSLLEDPDVRAVRSDVELWRSGEAGIAWQSLPALPCLPTATPLGSCRCGR